MERLHVIGYGVFVYNESGNKQYIAHFTDNAGNAAKRVASEENGHIMQFEIDYNICANYDEFKKYAINLALNNAKSKTSELINAKDDQLDLDCQKLEEHISLNASKIVSLRAYCVYTMTKGERENIAYFSEEAGSAAALLSREIEGRYELFEINFHVFASYEEYKKYTTKIAEHKERELMN